MREFLHMNLFTKPEQVHEAMKTVLFSKRQDEAGTE